MKRITLTFVLLGLSNYCFGQKLSQQEIKKVPLFLLDYDKEVSVAECMDAKELAVGQSNAKVLSDGMLINSTKHFIKIKQPELSQLSRMPQVPIDTTTHYHIQVIEGVEE